MISLAETYKISEFTRRFIMNTETTTTKLKRYTLYLESFLKPHCDIPEEVTYDAISYFSALDQCVTDLREDGVSEDDFAVDYHRVEEIA